MQQFANIVVSQACSSSMDRHITESFLEEERKGIHLKTEIPSDTEDIKMQLKNERSPVINLNVHNVNIPVEGLKGNTSDSEWRTTTDTSINSSRSLSASPQDVPQEVLEVCDGMDEVSIRSSPERPSSRRGRGRGRGRGQARVTNNSRKASPRGRVNGKQKKHTPPSESESSSSSRDSDSDSGSDSDSASGSEHSVCSGSCSHTSCEGSFNSSSEYSDSCCSNSNCSCSCHCDSSTSYDSTDDLTNLPRAKRGGCLGKKGSKKAAEKCNQS